MPDEDGRGYFNLFGFSVLTLCEFLSNAANFLLSSLSLSTELRTKTSLPAWVSVVADDLKPLEVLHLKTIS